MVERKVFSRYVLCTVNGGMYYVRLAGLVFVKSVFWAGCSTLWLDCMLYPCLDGDALRGFWVEV